MATTYDVGLRWTGGADAAAAVRAADGVHEALSRLERPRRVGATGANQARQIADEWQRMAAAADQAAARQAVAAERQRAREASAAARASAQRERLAARETAAQQRLATQTARAEEAERIRGLQAFKRAEDEKRNAAFRRLMAQQREEERFARYRIALDRRVAREAARLAAQQAAQQEARYRGYGRAAGGALGSLAGMAGGGIKGVLAGVGAAGLLAGKEGLETAQLIENARMRLRVQLGSAEAANAEIKDAFRIAEKTIFDPEQVLDALTKLSTNFKNADVRRYIMGAVSDFATASGEGSEGMERSIKAINQIFAKGKLQQEELTGQLGELGLPAREVYAQLATILNIKEKDEQKRTDKVIKLITAGKVNANAGIQAITTVMRNLAGGGAAGEFAVKSADTLSGMISNIKGGLKTLFAVSDIDQWPALVSLKDLLRDVAGFFSVDSVAGKEFVASLQRGIKADLMPVVDRIRKAFAALTSDPGKMDTLVRGVTRIVSWMADLAVVAVRAGAAFVSLWGAMVQADDAIMGAVGAAVDALRSAWASVTDIGGRIMQGLAQGIRNGAGAVYDAVAGVGDRILQSLKAKLGIASPSRRGIELGGFFAAGVGLGIDRGAQGVMRASAALGGAIEDGFTPRAQLGSGASTGGGGGASASVSVQINVSLPNVRDAAEFAAGVGPMAVPVLDRQLRQLLGRTVVAGVG